MKAHPLLFWLGNGSFLFCLWAFEPTLAQIVPDATMPVNSIVTPLNPPATGGGNTPLNPQGGGRSFVIEGGTRAGGNLFHSFIEFSVPTGGEAFFNNALDVQNIFSRVTGRSISNIDGLIRTLGTANLFLLNPNGIIFGPNASLNIGGSFLATTANSIKFADGIEFSATNPQTAPLLTISVPVGLQMGPTPGNIVVQGPGHNLSYVRETFVIVRDNRPVGLQVTPGQTLALLGGNLALEGGNLTAEGGRIELGSVGGETLVMLTSMNQGIALSYPSIENFQDISLSLAASVDATGAGGGDVFVVGRRVTLTDGSGILALTTGAEAGGTLSVRASEMVEAIGTTPDDQFPSGLFAQVNPGATGDGGNVTIETGRLTLKDRVQINTITYGQGNAGNLTIKARDAIELIGNSRLSTSAVSGLIGDGGNVTIETGRLTLKDRATIFADNYFGQGKAGNLTVKASDAIEVIGNSLLATSAGENLTRDGGNVTIETRRLTLKDGAFLLTSTYGRGKAGSLTIKASDAIELIGNSSLSTSSGSTGDSGNVTIETRRLALKDRAYIFTSTLFGQGKAGNLTIKASDAIEVIGNSGLSSSATAGSTGAGDAGNVIIETGRLILKDGATIFANNISGEGKGGNLTVKASDTIELIGNSGLSTSAIAGSTGDSGNLEIETRRLTIEYGSYMFTSTFGQGKAGNLTVKASDAIELTGNSGLYTSAAPYSTGNGGNVTIETGRLTLEYGSSISTSTFGQGKAGNLTVKASDAIELTGNGGFFASAGEGSTGDGGSLTIETDRLRVTNGTEVSVKSSGEGKAGNLKVDVGSIRLENSGRLTADTKAGGGSIELRSPSITLRGGSITTNAEGGKSGGNITVSSQFLQLRDGSSITTNAKGENVIGGNITLNTGVIAALENSDISANSINSLGGNVTINAQGIFGLQTRTREELQSLLNTDDATLLNPTNLPTSDITATGANSSLSGTLAINTPDVNPSAGLVELPANPIDATVLVVSNCRRRGDEQSEFIVTGRGGLPPSPNEPIRGEATWMDLREIPLGEGRGAGEQRSGGAGERGSRGAGERGSQGERISHSPVPSHQSPVTNIVEATGWVITPNGKVILTAKAPTVTPQLPWITYPNCD